MGYLFPLISLAERIRPEERDYERIGPSVRGIGDQEGERGKNVTGQAEIYTGPEISVEEIGFKSKERLETSFGITTLRCLSIRMLIFQ